MIFLGGTGYFEAFASRLFHLSPFSTKGFLQASRAPERPGFPFSRPLCTPRLFPCQPHFVSSSSFTLRILLPIIFASRPTFSHLGACLCSYAGVSTRQQVLVARALFHQRSSGTPKTRVVWSPDPFSFYNATDKFLDCLFFPPSSSCSLTPTWESCLSHWKLRKLPGQSTFFPLRGESTSLSTFKPCTSAR